METCRVSFPPVEQPIPIGQKYVITDNNVAYLTHNIHKFPSKFIPQIPRWAISKHLGERTNCSILDPMCGSGTTLVEGLLSNHYVYGVDIDPLARLISKVKTTPLNDTELITVVEEVTKQVLLKKKGKFLPSIPTLYHWFTKENAEDLSVIRDVIEVHRGRKDIYDFLLVTFSSIIRKVSNADDETQKTYVSHTNPKNPPRAKPEFIKNLSVYMERLREFARRKPAGVEATVLEGDARRIDTLFAARGVGKVDLAITSPPYVKAVDYIYTQMAEYFWIGDLFGLATQKEQNSFKRQYIGTKMIYAKEYNDLRLCGLKSVDPTIKKIYKKNRKFAYITYKFFQDLRSNLISMHKVLKENAHYVIVVGDCNVAGYPISVHRILMDLAKQEGYSVASLFSYAIRNRYMRFPRNGRGGLIENDWVVDLKRVQ